MADNCRMITMTVALCSLTGGLLICGCSHANKEPTSDATQGTSASEQQVLNDPNVPDARKQAILRTLPPPLRHASRP